MRNIIQSGGEWFAEAQRRVQSILPGKRKDGTDGEDGGSRRCGQKNASRTHRNVLPPRPGSWYFIS